MPIEGLEYDTNQWDGLGRARGPKTAPVKPKTEPTETVVVAQAPAKTPAPTTTPPSKHPEMAAWGKQHPEEVKELMGDLIGLAMLKATGKDMLYPIRKFIIQTKWKLRGAPVPDEVWTSLSGAYKTNRWDGTIGGLGRT